MRPPDHHNGSERAGTSCGEARALASAWIDGELADATALQAHLAHCGECGEHVEDLRAVQRLLAPLRETAGGPDLSAEEPDLWPGIAARTRALRRPAVPGWRTRVLQLAAALVGFAGTLWLLREAAPAPDRARSAPPIAGASWTSPLHVDIPERRLEAAPERRLLASLGRIEEERR